MLLRFAVVSCAVWLALGGCSSENTTEVSGTGGSGGAGTGGSAAGGSSTGGVSAAGGAAGTVASGGTAATTSGGASGTDAGGSGGTAAMDGGGGVDGGGGAPTMVTVLCGANSKCDATSGVCCHGTSTACLQAGTPCEQTKIYCDGSSDCPGGYCCKTSQITGIGGSSSHTTVKCAATCSGSGGFFNSVVVCEGANDCKKYGGTCKPATVGLPPGYNTCQ